MSDKDSVIETIRQMPEVTTLQQISEEIAIMAAIRKSEQAADSGQVTPMSRSVKCYGPTPPNQQSEISNHQFSPKCSKTGHKFKPIHPFSNHFFFATPFRPLQSNHSRI
jgi:hypothetical protein